MFLKIMSGENCPDGDSRKTFTLLTNVIKVKFGRRLNAAEAKKPENRLIANRGPTAEVLFEAVSGLPSMTETFQVEGNCYLMNEAGDTIASFGVAPPERLPVRYVVDVHSNGGAKQ